MTIGERMKARRKEIGMSAEELAEKIGKSPATVYRYEKGDIKTVDSVALLPIADALGITPGYLMGWNDITDQLHATFGPLFSPDTPAAKQLREIGEGLTGATISSSEARELLDIYYDLNDVGQQTLLGTARGLAANPDMKKGSESNEVTA